MHLTVGWCTYNGNIVLLDNGLCLWHNARKARRAVVPFIINITMEINFSSKICSKSLLKVGSLKGS